VSAYLLSFAVSLVLNPIVISLWVAIVIFEFRGALWICDICYVADYVFTFMDAWYINPSPLLPFLLAARSCKRVGSS
jgi:hypothetical protein